MERSIDKDSDRLEKKRRFKHDKDLKVVQEEQKSTSEQLQEIRGLKRRILHQEREDDRRKERKLKEEREKAEERIKESELRKRSGRGSERNKTKNHKVVLYNAYDTVRLTIIFMAFVLQNNVNIAFQVCHILGTLCIF